MFASFSEAKSVLYRLYDSTYSTKRVHNYKKGIYFLCWSFACLLSDSFPFFLSSALSQDLHFPESLHKWFLSRFGKWEALLDYLGVGERSSQGILPSPSLLLWHLWHWLCSLHNTSSHGIIIPIYFRSHKIATERFRLSVDGSASEPW